MKDAELMDADFPHKLRVDFINDLNTIVALSTHGPM